MILMRGTSQGYFSLGKFIVTLDCFCGQSTGTLVNSMAGNRDVMSTGNIACGKIPMSSPHFCMEIWTPSNTFSWAHPSHHSERHHDPFSRICTAHGHDRQTDRETEKERMTDRPSVAIGRIWLVLQCNNGAIHCVERLVFKMTMH